MNPNAAACTLAVAIEGANLAKDGTVWSIVADDPDAYNTEKSQPVGIKQGDFTFDGKLHLPPYSVTLYRLAAE